MQESHRSTDQATNDELRRVVHDVVAPQHFADDSAEDLSRRREKWLHLLQRYQRYGHYSVGNRVEVLEGGDAFFTELLRALGSARKRVWCESYIFDSSFIAKEVFEQLLLAARRGCDVVLLIDYIGSFTFPSEWTKELRAAGAEVAFFNPILPASAGVGPLSFRDHRKIMVCDDVGFCGGMNIHEEVGEAKYGTSRFYDLHAKLEGPCVADLAEVFRDTLREAGNSVRREAIPVPSRIDGGVYVQILQSNVRQKCRTLQEVIENAIEKADNGVFLATAYFFPPGFLRRALLGVPGRGVELSLLLSGSSDFYPLPGDWLAQTHFLGRFLRDVRSAEETAAGGQFTLPSIYLYEKRHMHAKYMSVDRVFSTIGSFNFDLYSARRNLEVGVAVFDHHVAARLQTLHQNKAAEAKSATLADPCYHNLAVSAVCWLAHAAITLSGANFFDGLDCFHQRWLMRKAALTFLLEEQAAQFVATSMMWGLQ